MTVKELIEKLQKVDKNMQVMLHDGFSANATEIERVVSDNNVNRLLAEVKAGTHKQFVLNTEKERVECRCGHATIWWRTGYLCGTITAYPCRFN